MKKVLSLFSGCGGMDLGFEGGFEVPKPCVNLGIHPKDWYEEGDTEGFVKLRRTSFETVFSNDILDYAEAAWKNYFSQRGTDVEKVFHKESVVELVRRHKSGEKVFPDGIDVVTGGFPCQDFSVAGKRKGFDSHKNHQNIISDDIPSEETRGKLYLWMREVVSITQPKLFIAENVKGLVSLGNVKKIIENDFRNIGAGYVVVPAKVLLAANYGVAQTRERVIFIGLNKKYLSPAAEEKIMQGNLEVYPTITHTDSPVGRQSPFSTISAVLAGLPEPENAKDKAQQAYSKAKYLGKGQGQTEVDLNGLGPTIRAEHHGNIEYRRLSAENKGKHNKELDAGLPQRRLTVRECARIQSFPDDYRFVFTAKENGKYKLSGSGAYKVIGNAVPPLMAYNIARHLENIWDEMFVDNQQ